MTNSDKNYLPRSFLTIEFKILKILMKASFNKSAALGLFEGSTVRHLFTKRLNSGDIFSGFVNPFGGFDLIANIARKG